MPSIVLIEKNGNIKEISLKEVLPDELYKKAGFKKSDGFQLTHTWEYDKKNHISLYAKDSGKAGSENKYDFPPPADENLFFGGCILTNQTASGDYCNLTKKQWENIYEDLFGGFDDVNSDDEEEEDDDDSDEELPKTKQGYVKDGFIVDDKEEEEDDDAEEEEDEDEDEEEEEEVDDINTEELCENDDAVASTSELESEEEEEEEELEEEEEEEEDDFYDSDGSVKVKKTGKSPHNKNKKKVVETIKTKVEPPKKRKSSDTKQKSKKTEIGPVSNYLNCSNELGEEKYV